MSKGSARWSQAQYDAYQAKQGVKAAIVETRERVTAATAARQPIGRTPNKTEALYHRLYLQPRILAGEVTDTKYEAITLKLAHDTRYSPDWCVWLNERLEFHEIKGAKVWDDALVKVKVAASMFPHRFVLAKKTKDGTWTVYDVPGIYTNKMNCHE